MGVVLAIFHKEGGKPYGGDTEVTIALLCENAIISGCAVIQIVVFVLVAVVPVAIHPDTEILHRLQCGLILHGGVLPLQEGVVQHGALGQPMVTHGEIRHLRLAAENKEETGGQRILQMHTHHLRFNHEAWQVALVVGKRHILHQQCQSQEIIQNLLTDIRWNPRTGLGGILFGIGQHLGLRLTLGFQNRLVLQTTAKCATVNFLQIF